MGKLRKFDEEVFKAINEEPIIVAAIIMLIESRFPRIVNREMNYRSNDAQAQPLIHPRSLVATRCPFSSVD